MTDVELITSSLGGEEPEKNRLWQQAITEAETSLRLWVDGLTAPSKQLIAESDGNDSNGLGAKLTELSERECKLRDKVIVPLLTEAFSYGVILGRRALNSLNQDPHHLRPDSSNKPRGEPGAATAEPQDAITKLLSVDLSSPIGKAGDELSAILKEYKQVALAHFQRSGLENVVLLFAGSGEGDPVFDLAGGKPDYTRIIYQVGQDPRYPPNRGFNPKGYLEAVFIGVTLCLTKKLTDRSLERMSALTSGVAPETPA